MNVLARVVHPWTCAESELGPRIEAFIREHLTNSENNNLGPNAGGKAWEEALIGFSSGEDDLWQFFKEHIGPFHWTPAEAFTLGRPADPTITRDDRTVGSSCNRPRELTVVSWALTQTETAKAANRAETLMPSEPWARSRIFGQDCNRRLHKAVVRMLAGCGYEAVAPGLLRQWTEMPSPRLGRACTWSERHVAYVSGLGTFSLSGGLITERGQAVRLGSLVVRAQIPATPRPSADPFAHCLYFAQGVCGACIRRCPAGAIHKKGRDKEACATHLIPATEAFVKRKYGFDGYGCGLCQTKVPCESGIPRSLLNPPRAQP